MLTSVDCVLFTIHENKLKVLLIKREHEPFKDYWTLCGGFIKDTDDSDFHCANRVLHKKTGIEVNYLEQLQTFASKTRDPRDWSVSIAWYALVHSDLIVSALENKDRMITNVQLFDVDHLPNLGFDHAEIISTALDRIRNKAFYSSLVGYLLPNKFTIKELQGAYEIVLKEKLNVSVFRRKLKEFDFLEEIKDDFIKSGACRPAQFFKMKDNLKLVKKSF